MCINIKDEKRLRILISAYSCEPFQGSERGNGWNWAYHIAKHNYEVWCLTTEKGKKNIDKVTTQLDIANFHIIYVKLPECFEYIYRYFPGIYLHYLIWQEKAYKIANELNKKINFDIVHHVTWGSFQLGTALWKLDKPLIFGPSGGGQFAPLILKKYFYRYWYIEIFRIVISKFLLSYNPNVKIMAKKAKFILATNYETYYIAKELGAKAVELFLDTSLPSEFYPKMMPLRQKSQKLRILWVGRLYARKGLPLVLDVLSRVDRKVSYELSIFGDGPLSKYLLEWINKFNLYGKVVWMGQVPWEQLKKAYLEHDVFMFCSIRDSSPAQLLEAMAYGLPIITLNLHGAKNLVPDKAGIKVEVKDLEQTIKDLTTAIEYMYYNPDMRHELGKRGYEFAKTQNWLIKSKSMLKYYNKIMDENKQN